MNVAYVEFRRVIRLHHLYLFSGHNLKMELIYVKMYSSFDKMNPDD